MKTQRVIKVATFLAFCLPGLTLAEDCQITLSQPIVDYKQLKRDDIVTSQQSWHKLPEREVTVNVFCPDKQKLAVLLQGNAGEKGRFRFGQNGGVAVKIDDMNVDGKSYTVGKTVDQLNFTPESGSPSPFYLRNDEAVVAVENNQAVTGQQMTFTATIFPVLNESAHSNNADQTTLESDLSWKILQNNP